MKKRLRQWREPLTVQDEQGQAIVIIAFAVVALILFAGLALDAATLYAGQSKLKRAVDAAALAGVVELPNEAAADARTRQFMLANGFDTSNGEALPTFETARIPSSEYMQWAVTATYRLRLNFLPLINFDYVEIGDVAVAEYRSMVDIYTSQTGGRGIVGPVHLANWGRYANPLYGDPYTPQCWTCSGGPAEVSEDPALCPDCDGPEGPNPAQNPEHADLYNEFNQGYPFRIHIPPGYTDQHEYVQIEILDPDGYNTTLEQPVTIQHVNGPDELKDLNDILSEIECNGGGGNWGEMRGQACVLPTGEDENPFWFLTLDENYYFNGRANIYDHALATVTDYRLYYHRQLADQSMIKNYLGDAYWRDQQDASTDLQWISPPGWEAVDLICDADGCDVPGIVVSEDGSFSLYVEVDGRTGSSKNGFDLWAGPPPTDTVPVNINERNVYLLQNPWSHDPAGVVTFGSGYLPLCTTLEAGEPIELTFGFIPIEASDVAMNLFHFDNDYSYAGQGIDYDLEGVDWWHYEGTLSLNGTWSTSANYEYQAPGSRDHDAIAIPEEFYGGYLKGEFYSRFLDTSTWHLEYEGVVGDVFVRLIK